MDQACRDIEAERLEELLPFAVGTAARVGGREGALATSTQAGVLESQFPICRIGGELLVGGSTAQPLRKHRLDVRELRAQEVVPSSVGRAKHFRQSSEGGVVGCSFCN